MPTWASQPRRSSSATSSAVVMPPAIVTAASPAAARICRAKPRSVPWRRPSRSTKVTRKPPTSSRSSATRSSTPSPVGFRQPSTTTSPCRASSAAITRSRGSSRSTSARAAVPSTTLHAPRSSHAIALATSRMPPPTRHGASSIRSSITRAFEPLPSAASRSTTAISPTRPKKLASGRGSPASSALAAPPTSWTAWPASRSIEGTIIAAASHGLPRRVRFPRSSWSLSIPCCPA